jgi:hypothetical protein
MKIVPSANTHTFQWDNSPWTVNQGGTGRTSFPVGAFLVGNGTNPLSSATSSPTPLIDIAVEQLDRYSLGSADEAHAHTGPNGRRFPGELDALGFEVGGNRVDAGHREPEMIEATVGRGRGGVDAVARRHRSDKDIGAPDLQVDACPAAWCAGPRRPAFSRTTAPSPRGRSCADECGPR